MESLLLEEELLDVLSDEVPVSLDSVKSVPE